MRSADHCLKILTYLKFSQQSLESALLLSPCYICPLYGRDRIGTQAAFAMMYVFIWALMGLLIWYEKPLGGKEVPNLENKKNRKEEMGKEYV